jgi:hypothetical protein
MGLVYRDVVAKFQSPHLFAIEYPTCANNYHSEQREGWIRKLFDASATMGANLTLRM